MKHVCENTNVCLWPKLQVQLPVMSLVATAAECGLSLAAFQRLAARCILSLVILLHVSFLVAFPHFQLIQNTASPFSPVRRVVVRAQGLHNLLYFAHGLHNLREATKPELENKAGSLA